MALRTDGSAKVIFPAIQKYVGHIDHWIENCFTDSSLSVEAKNRLRAQQIHGAIDQMRVFVLGNTLFAPVLSLQAWGQGADPMVAAWTASMLVFSWWLFFRWNAFSKTDGRPEDMRRFVLQTSANAMFWCIAMVLLYPLVSGDSKTVFTSVIVGSLALGTVGYSAAPLASLFYLGLNAVVVVFVPTYIGLTTGSVFEFLLAALALIASVAILQSVLVLAKAQVRAFVNLEDLSHKTEQLEIASAKLRHESEHDGLTGLLNRATFDRKLEEELAQKAPVGVIILDLNDFKPINDSLGHGAGDHVLKATADRMRVAIGTRGVVSRLGGDEFGIVVPNTSEQELTTLGETAIEEISKGTNYEGSNLKVTVSTGIALSNDKLNTVAKICAAADQAMYRCKSDRAKRPCVYREKDFPRRRNVDDKRELEDALRQSQIVPYFQPKVLVETGEIDGFEALARWEHPSGIVLGPQDFMDKIKGFNLLQDLTLVMVRSVLQNLLLWDRLGIETGRIAINIPETALVTQVGRDDLEALLANYEAQSGKLTFEITEDVVLARSGERIRNTISAFRKRGILISLDDFGTGYASFQHLREIELDELKIDRSFVNGLIQDRTADILVEGFMSIATGLDIDVVAEGVETNEQFEKVRKIGCKYAQGFLFGKAISPSKTLSLLSELALMAQTEVV